MKEGKEDDKSGAAKSIPPNNSPPGPIIRSRLRPHGGRANYSGGGGIVLGTDPGGRKSVPKETVAVGGRGDVTHALPHETVAQVFAKLFALSFAF